MIDIKIDRWDDTYRDNTFRYLQVDNQRKHEIF